MADDLLKNINLFELFASPTEEKTAGLDGEAPEVDFSDFEPEAREVAEQRNLPVEPEIPEKPYDARKEAEKLVNLIDLGNTAVLTPLVAIKVNKSRGGKKGLEAMRKAYLKHFSGKELTEQEDKLLVAFESYKNDLAILSGEVPMTKEQKEILINAAIPMCESRKMTVNSDFAFWGALLGIEAKKVAKIFMS